jgi:hypothetical protein
MTTSADGPIPKLYGTFRMITGGAAGANDSLNPGRVPVGQSVWLIGSDLFGTGDLSYEVWLQSVPVRAVADQNISSWAQAAEDRTPGRWQLTVPDTQPPGQYIVQVAVRTQPGPGIEQSSVWRPLSIAPAVTGCARNPGDGSWTVTGAGFVAGETRLLTGVREVPLAELKVSRDGTSVTFPQPAGLVPPSVVRVSVTGVFSDVDPGVCVA